MYREFKLLELKERLTKMGDQKNSLNQYKGLLTSGQPANNFNRPNLDYKNGGRLESTNYNTIKASSPSIYWNAYNTTDPILNFGDTSSDLNGGNFLSALSDIASCVTLVGGIAMTGFGIASAVKTLKGSKSNSNVPAADSNLASLTQTAENYDKKSDYNAMMNTANNLRTAITTAQQKLKNAQNTLETATNTLTNLNKQKTDAENNLQTFITNKTEIETSISTDKIELQKLENIPADQRTPEQNTQIEQLKKRIQENENKLKTDYSDSKQKQLENTIQTLNDSIVKWENIKLENNILVKQLPTEIKDAQKAYENLNNKIEKQAS